MVWSGVRREVGGVWIGGRRRGRRKSGGIGVRESGNENERDGISMCGDP